MSDGLYIHRATEDRPDGTRTMTVTTGGEVTEWVHADDFMAVQKERDDYRRALALVNAWRWSPDFAERNPRLLDIQLAGAGFTVKDGRAMLSLVASVQAESRASNPTQGGEG